jgi:hypothetical protein
MSVDFWNQVVDRLNRDELEMLYKIVFEESKKTLVLDEFGAAFTELLGLEEEEIKRLFMKVIVYVLHWHLIV